MTHGCSPFAATRRNLTPLDIVTAHSVLPGRHDVALLLEEAMRGEGWTGGRMEHKRRISEQRVKRKGKQKEVRDDISKAFGLNPTWWGPDSDSDSSDYDDEDEDDGIYVRASVSSCRAVPHERDRRPFQIIRPCSSFPRLLCLTSSTPLSPIFNLLCGTRRLPTLCTCLQDLPA